METWFREVGSVMRFLQTKIFPPNLPLSDEGCEIKKWWNWGMSNGSKSVQHTSLTTMASCRPTHKGGCEGVTGGRTDCGNRQAVTWGLYAMLQLTLREKLQMKETNLYGERIFLLVPR
jgi:hypothetical protein